MTGNDIAGVITDLPTEKGPSSVTAEFCKDFPGRSNTNIL